MPGSIETSRNYEGSKLPSEQEQFHTVTEALGTRPYLHVIDGLRPSVNRAEDIGWLVLTPDVFKIVDEDRMLLVAQFAIQAKMLERLQSWSHVDELSVEGYSETPEDRGAVSLLRDSTDFNKAIIQGDSLRSAVILDPAIRCLRLVGSTRNAVMATDSVIMPLNYTVSPVTAVDLGRTPLTGLPTLLPAVNPY
jgi:hypothetical protein